MLKSKLICLLAYALEQRDECPDCGGKGFTMVDINGEAEYDPCDCAFLVDKVLKSHKQDIDHARVIALRMEGYEVDLQKIINKEKIEEMLQHEGLI